MPLCAILNLKFCVVDGCKLPTTSKSTYHVHASARWIEMSTRNGKDDSGDKDDRSNQNGSAEPTAHDWEEEKRLANDFFDEGSSNFFWWVCYTWSSSGLGTGFCSEQRTAFHTSRKGEGFIWTIGRKTKGLGCYLKSAERKVDPWSSRWFEDFLSKFLPYHSTSTTWELI